MLTLTRAAGPLLDAAAWLRAKGRHTASCGVNSVTYDQPCSCGLDAVLAGLESLEGKTRE
jgi:hypothetical protein